MSTTRSSRAAPAFRGAAPPAAWLLAALALTVVAACGGSGLEPVPTPSPPAEGPPAVESLVYEEVCEPCGASFRAKHLLRDEDGVRFRINLEIANTGERGTLGFGEVTGVIFSFGPAQAELYRQGYDEARATSRIAALLDEAGVEQHPFALFLDAQGNDSEAPVIAPGEVWDGWLVFHGPLPDDASALIVQIRGIEGSLAGSNTRQLSGWVSFTEELPYIVVEHD